MVNQEPAVLEFLLYAPVPVAWKVVAYSANQFGHAIIVEIGHMLCRAIIERAAGEVDRLASPSDRTGFGPLTIDEFSLLLTSCSLGFFLTSPVPS